MIVTFVKNNNAYSYHNIFINLKIHQMIAIFLFNNYQTVWLYVLHIKRDNSLSLHC